MLIVLAALSGLPWIAISLLSLYAAVFAMLYAISLGGGWWTYALLLLKSVTPAYAVGMVVAHGNGTRASDASEVQALRRVFGEKLPPVTGFKWAFGHLIAASGVLDLVVAGKLNRVIAEELAISIKTVEAHRANIMEKLNANTVADLLKIALGASAASKS